MYAETVEDDFARATSAAVAVEELPVDDGWRAVVPELEVVTVTSNGHQEASGIVSRTDVVACDGSQMRIKT